MFDLLKKKVRGFTDKILGKSKEKAQEIKNQNTEKKQIKQENIFIDKQEKELKKDFDSSIQEKELKKKENTIDINKSKAFDNLSKDIEIEIRNDFKESKSKLESEKQSIPEKTIQINSKEKKVPSGASLNKKDLEEVKVKLEDIDVSDRYKDLTRNKKDIKTGAVTKIKSIFSSKIKLSEKEISEFLDDFEFSLLEADVSINSSSAIVNDLKKKLYSESFSKNNIMEDIKKKIKESLLNQVSIDCNINNYIKKNKDDPLIILIIGPNGAGKTTTIAKFSKLYKDQGKSVVLASSDTFRAGSIDQLQIHADRIGVKVIKQNYGSDPAAVAFDAVSSAKANKLDVVLIDTAGRQDTNTNLLKELQKIKRVVKPHLTLYVGESQSGQAIVEQISKFNKEIGISGVILTKIDTDPKGGVAISILNELKLPIFYIGTGQEYNDFVDFYPEYIINRII